MSTVPSGPTARTALGSARVGVGVLTLLAPKSAARVFGIDRRTDPWLIRLFGSRELALASALLAAQGADVRTVALVGAAIDGVDAISSGVEIAHGTLSRYTAVIGGGGALLFAALGLLAARASPTAVGTSG